MPKATRSNSSLGPARDANAAKQFFLKTLAASHITEPRVINVDKNGAYPKAFAELKAEGHIPENCQLRQVKYLNNLIEQDHRFIKRRTKPGMGFFSLETAWRTLQGCEIINMIRKGQVQGVDKANARGQVAWVAKLFGVVASERVRGTLAPNFLSFLFFATQPSLQTTVKSVILF